VKSKSILKAAGFSALHLSLLVSLLSLIMTSGCNLYGGIDSPSTDAQRLSVGQACFDAGNYSCALTNFSAVSTSNEQGAAESAFALLAESGAGFGVFLNTFGTDLTNAAKSGLTSLANTIATGSTAPSKTIRENIDQAYLDNTSINTTSLKNLVKFVSAISLASELLAEVAYTSSDHKLHQSLLANNATNCIAYADAAHAIQYGTAQGSGDCDPPTGTIMTLALSKNFNIDSGGLMSDTNPDLEYLVAAFIATLNSLSALTGSSNTGIASLSSIDPHNYTYLGQTVSQFYGERALRYTLLSNGVGQ